jgi:Rrf2 family protein
MLDLALHGQDGAVSLSDVARRQAISEKYLWQVVNPLKSAGLVAVTRGSKGGFMLISDPSLITLKDIVDAVEGESVLVDCVATPESCERSGTCVMQSVWQEVSQKISEAMQSVTLQSIVERQKLLQRDVGLDYVI